MPGQRAKAEQEAKERAEQEAKERAEQEAKAKAEKEAKAKAEQERKADEQAKREQLDAQGNPTNEDGTLKLVAVRSVDDLTDEDFNSPTRNVQLPDLPDSVAQAIGTGGNPVVIKKNIFEKNRKSHGDLTPKMSREILAGALYNPNLYGQNQKATRPYNWILVQQKDDKHPSVIIEVAQRKGQIEIVGWHYLRDTTLQQKKKQATKEGGLILALPGDNAVGNTSDGPASEGKGSELLSTGQETVELKTIEPARFDVDHDSVVTTTNDEAFADADDKAYDILRKFGYFDRKIIEDAKIRAAKEKLYSTSNKDDKAAEAEYNEEVAAAHKSVEERLEFIERHLMPVLEYYRARQEYIILKENLEFEEGRAGGDEWTEEEEKSYNKAWDEFEAHLEKLDAAYRNFAKWANSLNRQEEIASLENDFARLKEKWRAPLTEQEAKGNADDTRFRVGSP